MIALNDQTSSRQFDEIIAACGGRVPETDGEREDALKRLLETLHRYAAYEQAVLQPVLAIAFRQHQS